MKRLLALWALILLYAIPAQAGSYITNPKFTLLDDNGELASGACVYFYEPGTTTKKNIYTNEALSILATNPITLDSRGEASIFGSGEYKVVANGPASPCPITPDDIIWTADNVVVLGSVVASSGECDVDLFGAIPDDGLDDATAIQTAIDAPQCGTVLFPAGVYTINSSPKTIDGKPCGVSVSANKKLKAGSPSVVINVGSSFDLDGIAFMNASGKQALDTYADENIVYAGLTFTDSRVYPPWNYDTPATYGPNNLPNSDLTGSIIRCFSCERPKITNCTFKDTEVLNVAIGGCNNPEITFNKFQNTGYIYRGTYALWVSAEQDSGTTTKKPKIIGNTFQDIDNSGMLCGAGVENATVSNNQAFNTKEAAFHFINQCDGLVCTGNMIDGVYLGDISAHGIEGENLHGATIAGNTIKNCDRSGMTFIGIENSTIVGNTIFDNGAATVYPLAVSSLTLGINGNALNDTARCGLQISHGDGNNIVDNLLVTGNNIYDSTGNQKYAIVLGQVGVYRVFDHITVIGNDLTDGGSVDDFYWSTAALAGSSEDVKIFENVSSRITGAQKSSLHASIFAARQQGGEASAHSLGLYTPASLDLRAFDSRASANGIPTGWTFVRATDATYIDYAGVRQTAVSGDLRHDYDKATGEYLGWLIEPARTNSLLNSTSPATQTVSLAAGTYVLWLEGSGSCALSGGPTGTAIEGTPVNFTLGGVTNVTFTITGTVTAFQCELGEIPTSLITTAGAAVTRNADNLSLATSAFNFNAAEGTLLVEWDIAGVGSTTIYVIASLHDGTANELIQLALQDTVADDPVRYSIVDGGVGQVVLDTTFSGVTSSHHWDAFTYKANDSINSINGILSTQDTAGTLPTVTTIQIGGRASAAFPLNGHVRRVMYFPRNLHSLNSTGFRDLTRK
jgi:hypothetical protein